MKPIAIVGWACRLPGAPEPASLWDLFRSGIACARPHPAERTQILAYHDREAKPGRFTATRASYLEEIGSFDSAYFRIAPAEADRMDPQHRLLLELASEAMEDAGATFDELKDSDTACYIGLSSSDFGNAFELEPEQIDAHTPIGVSRAMGAGRVSHHFALCGPATTVDSACTSGLVALHLGCQSISSGESERAFVGAASLLLTPHAFLGFSRMNLLAPDGQSKPFSSLADGYGRGEGGVMLLLRSLEAATRAGDRIHAVIRGTAIGHSGRSNGVAAPSRKGQLRVMQRACAAAGAESGELQYVETHGAGSPLGDAIEIGAIEDLFAGVEETRPIGSNKGNFGHTEAVSGLASLMKVALSLEHGELAPTLHASPPNPRIDLSRAGLRIVEAPEPWSGPLAGVHAFGLSGTNAFAIVERPPARPPPVSIAAPHGAFVLCLSARSGEALKALAREARDRLAAGADPGRYCAAAARCRSHLDVRFALVGKDAETLIARLDRFLESRRGSGVFGNAGRRLELPYWSFPNPDRSVRARSPLAIASGGADLDPLEAQLACVEQLRKWGLAASRVVAPEPLAAFARGRSTREETRAALTTTSWIESSSDEERSIVFGAAENALLSWSDEHFLESVTACLYARGATIDWRAFYPGVVSAELLPTYPWQRSRHEIAQPAGRLRPDELVPQRVALDRAQVRALLREALGSASTEAANLSESAPLGTWGITSLGATEALELVERSLGATIPIADLPHLTLDQLTDRLLSGQMGSTPSPREDASSLAVPQERVRRRARGTILLTGATGFLGGAILRELLARSSDRIACLIRAPSDGVATERLDAVAAALELSAADRERLSGVRGDLAQPNLGWAHAAEPLRGQLAAIVHNGASVNWRDPYPALRASNVLATQALLERCAEEGATFHYISTTAVLSSTAGDGSESDFASTPPTAIGYFQSKWAAERLVARAAECGMPATIYRPGEIVPDGATQNPRDFLSTFLQLCSTLGYAPKLPVAVPLLPVSKVAEAIGALVFVPPTGRVYHLVSREAVPWATLLDAVGVRDPVPLEDFLERLRSAQLPPALRPYSFLLGEEGAATFPAFLAALARPVRSEETWRALSGLGVSAPHLDVETLSHHLRATSRTQETSGDPATREQLARKLGRLR